jgi:Flp pilus assembly protein TadG
MNGQNFLDRPELRFLRTLVGARSARLAAAWRRHDAGASAIELAIITAVLVVLAFAVLAVIKLVVDNNCNSIANAGGAGGGCS